MTLKEISSPISEHIKKFDNFFDNKLKSNVALLDLILKYLTRKKGKMMRPMLVFLTAELCGGITERAYTGASMIEFLHTATLIHDDVVDEAEERRGLATINAAWNNKIAVLIGDFLLAKGLLASIDTNEFDFLKATSRAIKRMSEGELLQIQKSREVDLSEETYFRIISNKTASLLASCCEVGAIAGGGDKVTQEKMIQFGEMLGTAFQIRDDIFDFVGTSTIIGKPVGNDLKEKKITLPLIYALTKADENISKSIVKKIKKGKLDKSGVNDIIKFTVENGGIDYAQNRAEEIISLAIASLDDFNDSPAKNSLIQFARFVIDRNK
jgi:octaprenyl-diphosphate synthase